eukprot:666046-Amphidinium_carterae.1
MWSDVDVLYCSLRLVPCALPALLKPCPQSKHCAQHICSATQRASSLAALKNARECQEVPFNSCAGCPMWVFNFCTECTLGAIAV